MDLLRKVAAAALWLSIATNQNSAIDDSLLLESKFLQSLVASGDGNSLAGSSGRLELTGQPGNNRFPWLMTSL